MPLESVRDFTGRGETQARVLQLRSREERLQPGAPPGGRPSFSELLRDFAADVNKMQFKAGHAIDLLATGGTADVHQVMVAVEQAGIALDLMLEVRNRVMEGYQELIRMQV